MSLDGHTVEGGQLIPSVSIEAILQRREVLREYLTKAHAILMTAKDLGGPSALCFDAHRREDFLRVDGVDFAMREYDKGQWEYLMTQSNMWDLLDAQARHEWTEGLKSNKFPDLTAENINATFSKIFAERRSLFDRGVIAVFQKLSWEYKTNTPVKFGRKVIMNYVVETGRQWSWCRPSFEGGNKLDDLLRVMHVLDGTPVPSHTNSAWSLFSKAGWPQSGALNLHDYIEVKGFKNGNAHVVFLREDLVDKMNEIIARHFPNALPPSAT